MNRSRSSRPILRNVLGLLATAVAVACSAAGGDPAASTDEAYSKGCPTGTRMCSYDPDIGSVCCSAGQACVNGGCQPVTKKGTVYPSQLVLGLLYRAPGNQSSVSYGAGSTLGAAWSTTTSNTYDGTWTVNAGVSSGGTGGSVNVSAGGSGMISGGFTSGSSSTSSVQVTKTTSESLTLASSKDALDHESDVFILWTNAEMILTLSGTSPTQVAKATVQPIGNQPIAWLAVTAAELDGSVAPVDATVSAFLATLTAADKASILALDALRAGDPSWYPQRFIPVPSTIEVTGPDIGLTDQVTFQGVTTSQSTQQVTNSRTAATRWECRSRRQSSRSASTRAASRR